MAFTNFVQQKLLGHVLLGELDLGEAVLTMPSSEIYFHIEIGLEVTFWTTPLNRKPHQNAHLCKRYKQDNAIYVGQCMKFLCNGEIYIIIVTMSLPK